MDHNLHDWEDVCLGQQHRSTTGGLCPVPYNLHLRLPVQLTVLLSAEVLGRPGSYGVYQSGKTEYRGLVDCFVDWCGNNNLLLIVVKTKEMVVVYRRSLTWTAFPSSGKERRGWRVTSTREYTWITVWTGCVTLRLYTGKAKVDSISWGSWGLRTCAARCCISVCCWKCSVLCSQLLVQQHHCQGPQKTEKTEKEGWLWSPRKWW